MYCSRIHIGVAIGCDRRKALVASCHATWIGVGSTRKSQPYPQIEFAGSCVPEMAGTTKACSHDT